MSTKLTSTQIAWRAAQDIADGAYVNLGIGFPEMVAKFQPPAARRSSTPRTAFWASAKRQRPARKTGT